MLLSLARGVARPTRSQSAIGSEQVRARVRGDRAQQASKRALSTHSQRRSVTGVFARVVRLQLDSTPAPAAVLPMSTFDIVRRRRAHHIGRR